MLLQVLTGLTFFIFMSCIQYSAIAVLKVFSENEDSILGITCIIAQIITALYAYSIIFLSTVFASLQVRTDREDEESSFDILCKNIQASVLCAISIPLTINLIIFSVSVFSCIDYPEGRACQYSWGTNIGLMVGAFITVIQVSACISLYAACSQFPSQLILYKSTLSNLIYVICGSYSVVALVHDRRHELCGRQIGYGQTYVPGILLFFTMCLQVIADYYMHIGSNFRFFILQTILLSTLIVAGILFTVLNYQNDRYWGLSPFFCFLTVFGCIVYFYNRNVEINQEYDDNDKPSEKKSK